jgi:hypothetical protein
MNPEFLKEVPITDLENIDNHIKKILHTKGTLFPIKEEGANVTNEGGDCAVEGADVANEGADVANEGADVANEGTDVTNEGTNVAVDIDSIDIGKIKISKECQRDDDNPSNSPSDSDSYYSFSSDDDEQLYISARDFTYYKDLLNINSFYEDKII